jgi:hypothetical protein
MIEPRCSIVINQVIVPIDIVVGFVEAVEGMGSFPRSDVQVVIAPVVMRGSTSSTSVALRSSLSSPSYLAAGASIWGGGGWRGLPCCLIALAAAAISLSLDLGGDRWDKGGGDFGVGKFRGFDDRRVREE